MANRKSAELHRNINPGPVFKVCVMMVLSVSVLTAQGNTHAARKPFASAPKASSSFNRAGAVPIKPKNIKFQKPVQRKTTTGLQRAPITPRFSSAVSTSKIGQRVYKAGKSLRPPLAQRRPIASEGVSAAARLHASTQSVKKLLNSKNKKSVAGATTKLEPKGPKF